jgi:hypothetical protein
MRENCNIADTAIKVEIAPKAIRKLWLNERIVRRLGRDRKAATQQFHGHIPYKIC